MNVGRIFITGDTHGNATGELRRFTSKKFKEGRELTKDDYVIVVGDFGLLWDQPTNISKQEAHDLNWLSQKPWTTLFLDGNHENFQRINSLPVEEKFGGPVGKVNESVYHLRRGYVYNISDINFFVFGGARSVDKNHRMPFVSWWEEEEPNFIEMKRGLDSLEKANNKVDFVLTHDCPSSVLKHIISHHVEPYQLTDYLQEVMNEIKFTGWFFGHHHQNTTINEKFVCLYNKIVEIQGL